MNGNNTIPPALQAAYDWRFAQTSDEILVTFIFPSTFNIHSVQANLELDNELISCSAPNHLPFFHGLLYNKVESIELEYKDETYEAVLHLKKKDDDKVEPWRILNKTCDPRNNFIDPKSAYLIFTLLSQRPENELSEQIKDYITQILRSSADAGFVPACITFGNICLCIPTTIRIGLSYLQIAAERYKCPEAFFYIGSFMLKQGETEQGLHMIEASLEMGYKNAAIVIGRLYSPLIPEIQFSKDGKKALELFKMAEHLGEAKYEMAKLYYYGCEGVEKDLEKAESLYKEAKQQINDLPPIGQSDPSNEKRASEVEDNMKAAETKWTVAAAAAGVVLIFGSLLFNHIRKQRK